ncbi:Uma2 family endonuclease [Nocardiopsis sp. RSe5-2]|uniref:Uma2 family endonuclease n=1 Tax=Nocardiopsis endophytica TaxID=3018445 RepID=A0ABT4UBF2_9ACTN|nr:Uma2 family endonuclease [Nocardiopsis endophytica]MDA2814301.1 Uma2 family endonuclease [Nocardiopsis endophytica]
MSVMSMGEWTPPDRPLTVDDLRDMPDDGRRYELVDGRLDVSPAPINDHSIVEHRISWWLEAKAPKGMRVFGTVGINLYGDRSNHRIPDSAVVRSEDLERPYLTRPPLLVVEVVSPESALRDFNTKRTQYARFGIPSYWVVSPVPEQPGIVEYRLAGEAYEEKAMVYGAGVFTTDAPFPVSLVPHWLVADDDDWKEHIGGPADGGAAG